MKRRIKMGYRTLEVSPFRMRVLMLSNRFGERLQGAVFWLSLLVSSLLLASLLGTTLRPSLTTCEMSPSNGTPTSKSLPNEFETLKGGRGVGGNDDSL